MPSLYGSAGGVNRKLRELYARDSGGTTRKLRELWGRDAGGANRKVFSGYDCQARLGTYTGMRNSNINSDGSGKIGIYSSFYQDDPRYYYSEIEFMFSEPLNYQSATLNDYYNNPAPGQVIKFGSSAVTANYADLILYNNTTNQIIGENYAHDDPRWTEISFYGLRITSTGSTSDFRLRIYGELQATSSNDDQAYLTWDPGNLIFLGKQINSVELI